MPTGTVQRTTGPSYGQVRKRPVSAEVPSLLGPRYPGQSAAKAYATDNVTRSATGSALAFIKMAPFEAITLSTGRFSV